MKLSVGDLAPEFCLPATQNRNVCLADYRGKNVLIAFFPQAWTNI